jgi:hypothetical protein
MISLLPRRLRTADPARGHRPGGGPADWVHLAGIARMLSWLTLAAMGIEGGVAIGAAVAAGSAALPGSGPDRGIEVMASIIVIRRFTGARLASATSERRAQQLVAVSFFLLAPCRSIPSPVPQPHGSGPWPTGLAWLGAMDEPATYLSHIELQRWSVRGPA